LDLAARNFAKALAAGVQPPPIASVYSTIHLYTPLPTRKANAHPSPVASSSRLTTPGPSSPVASSSRLTTAGPLPDDEIWWVVLRGDFPGVYFGKLVFVFVLLLLHKLTSTQSRCAEKSWHIGTGMRQESWRIQPGMPYI
jgi:hypothetical protein